MLTVVLALSYYSAETVAVRVKVTDFLQYSAQLLVSDVADSCRRQV